MIQVYICGMPGSGKSSLAKPLAQKLNANSFDLDNMIESMKGMRVPEILKTQGESTFRKYETTALTYFIQNNKELDFVISLGGGTVCFNNNLDLIKSNGVLIYLKTPIEKLLERLTGNTASRPLLNNGAKLGQGLETLLKHREPYFLQADLIIENTGNTDEMILEIENFLKK